MQLTITEAGNLPKLHPHYYIRIDMVHAHMLVSVHRGKRTLSGGFCMHYFLIVS